MPTRTETDRYKWPDDELHLIRVEPAAFRGSAHAPEPAAEPAEATLTNRESPESPEPIERQPVEPPPPQPPPALPDRGGVAAPEPVVAPERPEVSPPEPAVAPERPEVSPPEPVASAGNREGMQPPEPIDLFALARSRLNPIHEQVRR